MRACTGLALAALAGLAGCSATATSGGVPGNGGSGAASAAADPGVVDNTASFAPGPQTAALALHVDSGGAALGDLVRVGPLAASVGAAAQVRAPLPYSPRLGLQLQVGANVATSGTSVATPQAPAAGGNGTVLDTVRHLLPGVR